MDKVIASFFILLIKIYQIFLSPFLGKNCRFNPRCSVYTSEAIIKYGVIKGFYLSVKRLMKCHPFSKQEYNNPLE